jgi:hypothetical protein
MPAYGMQEGDAYGHVHIGSYDENMHAYMAGWRDVPAYGMQEGES